MLNKQTTPELFMTTLSSTARWDYLDPTYRMDLTNLERLPTDGEIPLCNRLAQELNDLSDRIELNMLDIMTTPGHTFLEWEDTLTWKTKQSVLRRRGASKKDIGNDEFGHISSKDEDDPDEKAYQNFLNDEFTEVA
jgi:hypothetical protein